MAEEAAGQSPAFSFPVWVARTQSLQQEAQPPLCQPPCASHQPHGQGQQQGRSLGSAMDTRAVLDNLCQSSARPGAAGTETLGCPRLLWGTRSRWHSTHTPVPCPQLCWLPALQRLCLLLHAGCVSMFVFLRRCPGAAFRGPFQGTTSLEGPAALPDVSRARPWDSFGATRPGGTTASRA